MRQLLRRVWYAIRQRQFEADLAEEMDFHREMKQREVQQRGVEPEEAAFAASRALGSLALARDRARDVWQPHALQGIGADIRLAARTLRSTPIVSIVAVLSLALGIGANTAIFSLANSLLLRSLPVSEPDRLVVVADNVVRYWPSNVWDQIQRQPDLFDSAGACVPARFDLAASGETDFVDGLWASGSYLYTLGVHAVLGRVLSAADDQPGGGPEGPLMMISYGFWQRRFGGAPDVVGRKVSVNGVPVSIVGVTPRDFFGTDVGRRFDVLVPIADEPRVKGHDSAVVGGVMGLMIFGRLKQGQTREAATAALRAVQPAIRDATLPVGAGAASGDPYLRDYLKVPFTLLPAATGFSSFRDRYKRPLVMILGAAGLVLLLACANVANLLLARAASRRHELSVRVAIGASRWRLVRALLLESALLAGAAAAAGLAIASWASRLLVRHLSTETSPVFLDLPIDWRLLTFVMMVAAATLVLFGIVPAIRASNVRSTR
jgi:predicted permease